MEKKDTKICKHCKEEIAKSTKRCPKCGGKLGMPGWAKALIVIVVILVCLVSCMNSCSKAVDEAFGGYDDQTGKTTFKVGETFESKYIKLTLDSTNYSKYADVKSGYKVVQFKFTAENIGDDNQNVDYTDFDCYADEQSMKQFYSTDDAGLDGGGTISKGKKVSFPVYCEVPKDAKKVTVEFKPILADKNYEFVAE